MKGKRVDSMERTTPVTVSLAVRHRCKLQELSDTRQMTISGLVREALDRMIESEEYRNGE